MQRSVLQVTERLSPASSQLAHCLQIMEVFISLVRCLVCEETRISFRELCVQSISRSKVWLWFGPKMAHFLGIKTLLNRCLIVSASLSPPFALQLGIDLEIGMLKGTHARVLHMYPLKCPILRQHVVGSFVELLPLKMWEAYYCVLLWYKDHLQQYVTSAYI